MDGTPAPILLAFLPSRWGRGILGRAPKSARCAEAYGGAGKPQQMDQLFPVSMQAGPLLGLPRWQGPNG